MPKTTSKKVKGKPREATDVLRDWLKANFNKGDLLEVTESQNILVFSRTNKTTFQIAYKAVPNKAKKK